MRSFIIITVLSAFAACYSAAVLPREEEMVTIIYDDKSPNGTILSRADFNARSHQGWVLLSETNDFVPAVEGQVQSVGVFYRANFGVRIDRLVITTYGHLIPDVDRTPLGSNKMIVILTSRPGELIRSTIETYKRDNISS
ncbi:uncharacterized protein LOC111350952 [Spodoptera litura]|uniref:Uncharacterized protein LOC111350952 n=1 Tax=Spodoptera litura TaxID=69820 RepID=A0A9J7DY63_SPOLT|nr:uncharacterized protein LOC111350952 [Spodoptera litura]